MTRIYLYVEGQSEERFVKQLLIPHCQEVGVHLAPVIVKTSPGYKGGVVTYGKIRPQILGHCKQDSNAYVTTMLDLYRVPADFPGKANPACLSQRNGQQKAAFLEAEFGKDISSRNFIPNLLVHEFEALLFTQLDPFTQWLDDKDLEKLRKIRKTTAPEDINDTPSGAPSKRILSAMRHYKKTTHGTEIANTIGLNSIRAACPHFDGWLKTLECLRTT